MSKTTTNLNLYEVDPTTDGALTFNIKTMLNDNWDKVDAAVAAKETPAGAQAKADSAQATAEAYTDAKFPVPSTGLGVKAVTTAVLANPPMFSLPNLLHPSAQQFTRGSNASRKNLAPVPYNVLRYEQGKFGLGAFIEEATTNLVYNSDFETITGTSQLFNDPLTSYTGSSAAPWTVQAGGSFTFGASGATSGALASFMTAGNAAWKPLTGSNGSVLTICAQATVTTQSTVSGDAGAVFLWQDSSNYYYANLAPGQFNLGKRVSGGALTNIATVGQTIAASTAYTIQLIRYQDGRLTANLYSGVGTGGTLLQQLLATDTNLTGGFIIGVGGDTGVVIKAASVTGPWADGWIVGGDTRVAWGLTTTNPISGNYSVSAVGAGTSIAGSIASGSVISPSTGYTESVSLTSSNIVGSVTPRVDWYTSSVGTLISNSYSNTFSGTNSPQRNIISNAQSPSNATYCNSILAINGTGAVTFDAIQLEQKAYATTYVRNDSTTATASRSADSLQYSLSQPLPSRIFGALMWTPNFNSNIQMAGNTPYVFQARNTQNDPINDLERYGVRYYQVNDSNQYKFEFYRNSGSAGSPSYTYLWSDVITFNAGDNIFIAFLDDPVAGYMYLWVGVNGGALKAYSIAISGSIKDAQTVWIGNAEGATHPCDGTIDFPIITSQIPTTEQVNALYYSAEWGGTRDYPGALPDKVIIGDSRSVLRRSTSSGVGSMQLANPLSGTGISMGGGIPGSGTSICTNCFFDEATNAFYRVDTTKAAFVIVAMLNNPAIGYAPPGTGAISWTYYTIPQVLSGGYKVQSGTFSNVASGGVITFPVAFTVAPLVFLNNSAGASAFLIAGNSTTTQFNVYSSNGASSTGFWFAIGI